MIQKGSLRGFSRLDLLVLVGAVGFLMLWIVPALCRASSRSERAICVNNLRVIGGAFARWASENGERNPWQLYRPSGATLPPNYAIAWFNFLRISNQLGSPKFLADPADRRTSGQPALRVATSWHDVPGGFLNVAYRNNAVSYSIGMYSTPAEPNSIVSSDRNIHAPNAFNDYIFQNIRLVEPATAAWKHSVHIDSGNLLFNDGRVEETDTPRLKEAVGWNNNWNRGFLFPFVE